MESINHMTTMAYTAGLVDGDGSIGNPDDDGTNYQNFRIVVALTDKHVIDWLHLTFGGSVHQQKKYGKQLNKKVLWRWTIQGKRGRALYDELSRYMKIK